MVCMANAAQLTNHPPEAHPTLGYVSLSMSPLEKPVATVRVCLLHPSMSSFYLSPHS